jgi:hypothetical protein
MLFEIWHRTSICTARKHTVRVKYMRIFEKSADVYCSKASGSTVVSSGACC